MNAATPPAASGEPADSPGAIAADGSPDNTPALRLAAVSDTSAAPALKEQLTRLTAHGGQLAVLGRDVQRITTACIQLLLAADRSLARHGGGLLARAPSEAMRHAFAELGLSADLDRWIEAHG